jgi:putative holliday junction resolvase
VRVLALDYGLRRTGVAVSDASGTLARPVSIVDRAGGEDGLKELERLISELEAELVIVGMPLTLRGEHGRQAQVTEEFVSLLRARVGIPVETFDERYTTALAQQTRSSTPEDALAAAHLLQGWLDRRARQ